MVDRSSRRDTLRQTASMTPPMGGTCSGSGSDPSHPHANPELLHRLQALDFSIYDTVLYLDAYPDSADALAYYNKLIAERDALIGSLSASHHAPVTVMDNVGNTWDWVHSPWPWEASAN